MTREEVKLAVIQVLREIASEFDVTLGEVPEDLRPLDELGFFDSPTGVIATIRLEEILKLDIPPDTNLFVEPGGKKAASLKRVIDLLMRMEKRKDAAKV